MHTTEPLLLPALFPVLHALPWPAVLLDEEGRVVCVNAEMERRGLHPDPHSPPSLHEALPEYAAVLRSDLGEAQEALVTRQAEGKQAVERVWLRPIADGAVLIVTDETRLAELETEHAQTVRLASLGFMLAGVCHEISNPLAAIHSMLQILESEARRDPEVLERGLASISANVRRILEISRQLSGFSRAATEPRRPVAVDSVLEEALALVRHERTYREVAVEHHKDPAAVVRGNPRELLQVFFNVLANAVQAMEGHGRILITTRRLENEQVEIMIQDDGPGIRPEHLPKLFDPFFSTKARGEGTGLGLTISNEIIHEHGGHMRAESTYGKGARFYIELPLWRRPE
jgi:signal transduction histidine kinase